MSYLLSWTKERKDLNINLYFLKMKKSFVVLLLIHRKWKTEFFLFFIHLSASFFFTSKNIVKIKWEHQRLISSYLNFCYPLFTLLEAARSKKKDTDSLVWTPFLKAEDPSYIYFSGHLSSCRRTSDQRESVLPKSSGTKGYRGTRFKSRLC